jgi:biotin operon repressor
MTLPTAAPERDGQWRIEVLGTLAVSNGGRRWPDVGPVQSAVVVLLALAGRRGRTAEELQTALHIGSRNALEKHLSELRKRGLPVPHYGALRTAGYALDMTHVSVDALDFVTGVSRLGEEADPALVSELLAMWREDPRRAHPRIDASRWNAVIGARHALVRVIENMPQPSRALVTGLTEFAELFPDDPRLRMLVQQEIRKRLLVVEDMNMDYIIDALGRRYNCIKIADLEEWWRYLDQVGNIVDVNGALIDLHLTDQLNDDHGLDIAEWLRDNSDIPVALMTMALPAGDLETWTRKQRGRFRLVKIIHKGRDGLDTAGIREAAECLTSEAERHQRVRLETWLESHIYQAEESFSGRPLTESVVRERAEFRREAARARQLVADAPLDKAQKAVDELHQRRCPRH